jgi:predicted amidohydrolase
MTPVDYLSEAAFFAKLESYMDSVEAQGWLNPRTVLVFPEYIGTWLVITGEGRGVAQAQCLEEAMHRLAVRHLFSFIPRFLSAGEADRAAAALFRLKAERMAQVYQSVFSNLAQSYEVTVVAGSTVLPTPTVRAGQVRAGEGPLYGVSAVFDPEGRAYEALVRKAFPTGIERPFMAAAQIGDLPAFDTPAGRLGVLICADAWYPHSYARLETLDVDLIAVPSYIASKDAWAMPWRGYDGATAPQDVEPRDVGTITEGEAWRRYALAGRIDTSGARAGINVFLTGSLWDLGGDGQSLMVVDDRAPVTADAKRPALLNLWL